MKTALFALLIAASVAALASGVLSHARARASFDQAASDPSGLSEAELNSALPPRIMVTKEQIEERRKDPAYYEAELQGKPEKSMEQWMRLIDTLQPGMFEDQVEAVLPRASVSTSQLWAYDGIQPGKTRQTHFWALDATWGVAVTTDYSGTDREAGPALRRHQNRLVSLPVLLRHDGRFDEYGCIKSEQFRYP